MFSICISKGKLNDTGLSKEIEVEYDTIVKKSS
jgi:hypothetical protein